MLRKATSSLAAALHLTVLVGLLLNSQPGGAVFGRYTWLYVLGLALYAATAYPLLRFVAFLTRTDERTTRGGRRLRLTPMKKLKVLGTLALVVLLPLELVLWKSATRRTARDLQTFHPFLQIQGRPHRGSVPTNAHGFRGDAISLAKPPGVTRVFVLGGSTVYCRRVGFEESHVRLLETGLAARLPGRRFEVQNAGMDWYTSEHSLINYLFRIKDFQPDLLIVFHGINDLYRSFSPERWAFGEPRADYAHFYGPVAAEAFGRFGKGPLPRPYVLDWLLERNVLFSDLGRPTPVAVDTFPSLASFERNLRSLARAARADGVQLVLATQPSLYRHDLTEAELRTLWMNQQLCQPDADHYADAPSMARGMAAFAEATRRVAGEEQVPLIELEPAVPKDLEHFVDDVHYTVRGNARVAEVMLEGLLRLGVLAERPEGDSGPAHLPEHAPPGGSAGEPRPAAD